MKVLLIDYDSVIPNLALMKLSAYHQQMGNEVGLNVRRKGYQSSMTNPDKVLVSVIFFKNSSQARGLASSFPDADVEFGGAGIDMDKGLPSKIEYQRPDYDIYKDVYPDWEMSMGFTTRGCNRNCYFCIVCDKEGWFHKHRHPKFFHDWRHDKIQFLDNNVLYDKEWFEEVVTWCHDNNLQLEWNQGLDIRLVDENVAHMISQMDTWTTMKFAFDKMEYKDSVMKGVDLLKENGVDTHSDTLFYVYCHNDDQVEDALERCNLLKERDVSPYVMLNIDKEPSRRMKRLRTWVNQKNIFWACSFEEYKKDDYKTMSELREEKRQKVLDNNAGDVSLDAYM